MLKIIKIEMLALLALVLPAAVGAQGQIIPHPIGRPVRIDPLSVKSMFVDVDIERQVATTTIEQVFHNQANRILEGMYLFPIPEKASISKFTMWMNGEEVEGEVVEAKKARQIYEDIVRRMRDPGLLEYLGQDLFRARVFPIPAKGDVQIKIVYEEILVYNAGLVAYRHPLKVDGNRVKTIGQVSMAVEIDSDVPVKSLYSPTHDIDVDIRGRTASCGFEVNDAVLDRDFLMYYTVSTDDVGLNLLTHRRHGGDGYFMLLVSPGRLGDPSKVVAKDVVFVVDKSGSMKGEKIEQAKGALSYCIQNLNRSDRFNIILFSTNVVTYSERLVMASRREKDKAADYIDGITARGGTDVNNALLAALESLESDRPRTVIFLTDGRPTVGEANIEIILSNLRERNDSVRIFPFGVGYDVNTKLLDQLSMDHRGAVDYIRPEEDIELKVARFYDKVSNPVLSDVELNVRGIELVDVYPRQLPDIFDGTQLVVLGRYRGTGSSSITLTGDVGGREREFDYEGTFKRRSDDFAFIPRIWANRKIAYLLSEIKLHGADRELVDEVIELSLEHGIITPYTSYLILEEGTDADREQLSRALPQPLMGAVPPGRAPAVDALAITMSDAVAEAEKPVSGEGAVGLSRDLAKERKSGNVAIKSEEGVVRYAGGKRFALRGDEWVDEDYHDDMDVIEVEFLSDRYFELLREHPDIKHILALGENVTFVFEKHAYRITS
jgi:Ca-activated chloride channel family protein